MATATFAAGCFWGVEARFREIKGVEDTVVGYTGGTTENPTYKEVCSGRTGHAEGVRVTFNPKVVSYEDLLRAFWAMHNPTTLNRQGPDRGSQYRSAVFVHDDDQRRQAEAVKHELDSSDEFSKPIVTEVTDASPFYKAEEYHQRYYEKNRGGIRCH